MKRFVDSYPEFRKLGGNVNKHVALVGELSRLVGRDKLLEVSEAEQTIVGSGNTHANDLRTVQGIIENPGILPVNKLRLAMLYALRYQRNSSNAIPSVVELLKKNGVSENESKVSRMMDMVDVAELIVSSLARLRRPSSCWGRQKTRRSILEREYILSREDCS